MDLILVNPNSTPPVCRLGDAGAKKRIVEKKQKEIRATQRARSVKEMHIGSSIFENDLNTKLNKVKEFLESFHPVRVSFIADAKVLEKNPLSLDEIILKVLQLLEKDAGPVQPMPVRSRLRRDILFNPKPATEGAKKK
jgi:translation initiation factor IF-3